IGCAVDFLCRLLHLKIILLKKPLRTALCNKAVTIQNRINIIVSYFQLPAFIILNLAKGWVDYINFVIWT
ncbi:hypothetical protein QP067_10135, partial [Acinetobacter baumannii]|nr:hypothetical protein [Acinetobacter baumannii]MDK6175843.1 hypothetical protein [Acinetobacter baumannii]